jgi:hypothetical protein
MKDFIEATNQIAQRVLETEQKRKSIASIIRKNENLYLQVAEHDMERLAVAGVDGGIIKKSLHGIDLLLLRAAGVIFYFENGKLKETKYFPQPIPSPVPEAFFDPFSDVEFEINANMKRQIAEITTAQQIIEKFSPDILVMHGSIVPHYTSKAEGILLKTYDEMMAAYKRLFSLSGETLIAGVVEDSRGKRFCDVISDKVKLDSEEQILLERTRDTNLLTYLLKFKERTFSFPYAEKNHFILKEFPEFSEKISTFYMRTAEFDRPIRIDFLGKEDEAEKISSMIFPMVKNSSYGIPSILVEADQRAKLTDKDFQIFFSDLMNKVGRLPVLFELRREDRPL